MTTQSEIRKWVKPLLEWRPDMVLAHNILIFRSFGHVMRGVAFFATSYRNSPNIRWFLFPAFVPFGLPAWFDGDIPVGLSDGPCFYKHLDERVKESVARYLLPHESIQNFHDFAMETEALRSRNLHRFPIQHSVVLTALGRFEEAEALLAPAVAELHTDAQAELDRGRMLLAKRANSVLGKQCVRFAENDLKLTARLMPLLAYLGYRDHAAIAALLREWERESAEKRHAEEHWQPTPFPFETD